MKVGMEDAELLLLLSAALSAGGKSLKHVSPSLTSWKLQTMRRSDQSGRS